MKLLRIVDAGSGAPRIRSLQRRQRLKSYQDKDGYACYDEDELNNYKPAKRGAKLKGNIYG